MEIKKHLNMAMECLTDNQSAKAQNQAWSHVQNALNLLDKSLSAQGLQIFIGEESGYQVFNDYSMVTAPYTTHGKVIGVLGIIGPKRMRYNKVVSVVDMTAKLLSQALEIRL